MTLDNVQIHEAIALRDGEDKTWKEIAKHFGLKESEWQSVRDQVEAAKGRPEATSDRIAELMAQQTQAQEDHKGDTPGLDDVAAAQNDRALSEEEVDDCVKMYRGNASLPGDAQITFKQMAEALDPPVHWLTVADALGKRGWRTPTKWVPPYSTATDEGKAQLRADKAAGRAF